MSFEGEFAESSKLLQECQYLPNENLSGFFFYLLFFQRRQRNIQSRSTSSDEENPEELSESISLNSDFFCECDWTEKHQNNNNNLCYHTSQTSVILDKITLLTLSLKLSTLMIFMRRISVKMKWKTISPQNDMEWIKLFASDT